MARKIKIENHIQKRANTKENRNINVRSKRKYFLIVCEGEKTEPNYFESLKKDLPKGVLSIYIKGIGRNTLSLVQKSKEIKERLERENRVIDKIWVVFDRDSFEEDNFNSAINSCKNSNPEIGCAWTNEAFELWYLLHFHYYNTAIKRERYKELIEKDLKPFLGEGYKYKKNSTEMYGHLKEHGNIKSAIEFAKRLESEFRDRHDYANQNPLTKVHHLVIELFESEEILYQKFNK